MYYQILRGRNVADQWKRAHDARLPSVSVLESGVAAAETPVARLVLVDLPTNARTTLARGAIHRLNVSADRRSVDFLREEPGVPGQSLGSLFERAIDVEQAYAAVNWGTARHVIDAQSGSEVEPGSIPPETSRPAPKPDPAVPLPRPDAQRLSVGPVGDVALYIANASDGSHLWLCGGAGRPMSSISAMYST